MKTFKIFILLAMILPCLCACDSPVSDANSNSTDFVKVNGGTVTGKVADSHVFIEGHTCPIN